MYKHYIFDLYGTLIDLRTDEEQPALWRELAKFYGYNGAYYEAEELQAAYLARVQKKLTSARKRRQTEHPDIKISTIFGELYRAKQVRPGKSLVQHTMRLFRSLSLDYLKLYDGVPETLEWLKARGGKLYLLSNGQREFSLPELQQLGLIGLFDAMYFSADYELCKPDVRFMEVLLAENEVAIADAVMIGNDHTTDIEIARRLGMDAVYIHTNCSHNIKRVQCKYRIWDNKFRKLQRYF